MPTVKTQDSELFYESYGAGDPVVLLHGAGGNHLSWWQQVPSLSRDLRVIVLDHRGFGRSPDPSGLGAAAFIDDLVCLLDRLEIARTALVCQSMGGITGLGLAVRDPGRVSALALCNTWGFFRWPHARDRQREAARASEGARFAPLSDAFTRERPELALLYQQIMAQNPPESRERLFARGLPNASGKAAFGPEAVAALDLPTLCVTGSEDGIVPPSLLRDLAGLMPRAKYLEVAGCGHSVYWERPDVLNPALRELLTGTR